MEKNYTIPGARKSFVSLGTLGVMAAIGAGAMLYGTYAAANNREGADSKVQGAYASRIEQMIEDIDC